MKLVWKWMLQTRRVLASEKIWELILMKLAGAAGLLLQAVLMHSIVLANADMLRHRFVWGSKWGQTEIILGHFDKEWIQFMKKSNHARLQSIMNRFNPSIPEPCCVPDKMMPLSILFFDSENRDHIVLKVFPNMAVASCACRWLAAFKFCLYKCILSILYILYTIYQNAMWLIQIY